MADDVEFYPTRDPSAGIEVTAVRLPVPADSVDGVRVSGSRPELYNRTKLPCPLSVPYAVHW